MLESPDFKLPGMYLTLWKIRIKSLFKDNWDRTKLNEARKSIQNYFPNSTEFCAFA